MKNFIFFLFILTSVPALGQTKCGSLSAVTGDYANEMKNPYAKGAPEKLSQDRACIEGAAQDSSVPADAKVNALSEAAAHNDSELSKAL